MFSTTDLDAAVAHWTDELGFVLTTDQRPSWAMLTDPATSQRIALLSPSEGSESCLGLASEDLAASLAHVLEHGGTVHTRTPLGETGFQWASCTDGFGIPLLIWNEPAT